MNNEIDLFSAPRFTRRHMLGSFASGFGSLAMADLLGTQYTSAQSASPLDAKASHFPASAKRVIFLFMAGGPSQMDTYDYKPELQKMSGKTYEDEVKGVLQKFADTDGVLFGSPFKFQRHGQCGQWVSELFPHTARHVDEMCFLKGMHTEGFDHGQAGMFFHTGASNFVRPSLGSSGVLLHLPVLGS